MSKIPCWQLGSLLNASKGVVTHLELYTSLLISFELLVVLSIWAVCTQKKLNRRLYHKILDASHQWCLAPSGKTSLFMPVFSFCFRTSKTLHTRLLCLTVCPKKLETGLHPPNFCLYQPGLYHPKKE